MKSCIFVNKYTPKFKEAREKLLVIRTNCTLPGFSSVSMNTAYGDVWLSIASKRVIKKLSTFPLGCLLILFFFPDTTGLDQGRIAG